MFNWKTLAASAAMACSLAPMAEAKTEIELFFPVPVEGKLATEMKSLMERFNTEHPDIAVTPVYTGTYDETAIKTRAAIKAGNACARLGAWAG